jgi:hypothetical protein
MRLEHDTARAVVGRLRLREPCERASAYAKQHDTRQWHYLLIPHDAVTVNKTLPNLAAAFAFKLQ